MPNVSTRLKLLSILLITTILCAGCEVPDLTEFTAQSAEMTRGIRTGVKDTEKVIKTASDRNDLFSDKVRAQLRQSLKDYREALKPTGEALDALDAYLEALNALAQANKKSAENSKAVVNAVSGLVTAASGLTFAGPALNVAAGLLTLAEQFRTTRDFKKRVNLAAQIVEGGYNEKVDANGKTIFVKACTGDAEARITGEADTIKSLVAKAMVGMSEDQLKELQPLSPHDRRKKLQAFGRIGADKVEQIVAAENVIASFSCGVIDLIKFNVKDLKQINLSVSITMFDNAREKNRTVLGFYNALESTDRAIQHELETILNYKTLTAFVRELEATKPDPDSILVGKISLKHHVDDLFAADAQLRNDVTLAMSQCGPGCGNMQKFLEFDLCDTCRKPFAAIVDGISKPQFDTSNGHIEAVLDERAAKLYEQNTKYVEELKRITPAHSVVISELKSISEKQEKLDQLLDASASALDTWATSHANLRVAVNTRKPLGVAQLASKVREIWSIINPSQTN